MSNEAEEMKKFIEEGRGSGEGPDDEHEIEEVQYADSERRARDRSW